MKKVNHISVIKHLLYWVIFILFFTLVWGTYDHDYLRNLMVQLYSLPARLILVYTTLYVLFPLYFLKKRYARFIIFFIVLLIIVALLIQRPIFLYYIKPKYLSNWESTGYLEISSVMNTILDINLAAFIPIGYTLFKFWNKAYQKSIHLEKKNQELTKQKEDIYLYLKVGKTREKVLISDILYIESLKNYIKVTLQDRDIVTHKSISEMQSILSEQDFLRVHRSFIINKNHVDSFSPSKVVIKENSIPIGRKYKENVKLVMGYF